MIARLFFILCISFACFPHSSCRQQSRQVALLEDEKVAFREDFSGASKRSYAAGTLAFATGQWYLADALAGNSEAEDAASGTAVRIRNNGKLQMLFDVEGAQKVYVGYAVFGKDDPSEWQLWMSDNGGGSYRQVNGTITARNTAVQKVAFDVPAAARARFEIRKISGGSNRLLIASFAIATSGSASPAQPRSTGVSTSVEGDNGHLLLGNPTQAVHSSKSENNYLIDHGYYVESYNRAKCIANWVSWHVGIGDLGDADRQNDFRPYTSLPGGWYTVDDDDYKNTGFDKGHNCPSADRTASKEANSSTFLMDNIIPQAPNNNQHTWEHLESYCREQVKRGNEVYIIMGNYGTGGTGSKGYASTIAGGKINVPARIWKVVVIIPDGNNDLNRINSNTRVIAIDTPNDNNIERDWMKYLTTVAAIEKAAGVDLLSALPDTLENILSNKRFVNAN